MLDVLTVGGPKAGAVPLVFEFVAELAENDLLLLDSDARVKVGAPPIERIRPRHHALAKSLARGMRPGIAAATHGFSVSRVSILASDPTFKELVEHYRREEQHDYANVQERLTGITVAAMDELAERIEEDPKSVPTAQLTRLVMVGADRTGHGPKAQTDVNITLGLAERMRQARERLERPPEPEPKTIEGEILEGVSNGS